MRRLGAAVPVLAAVLMAGCATRPLQLEDGIDWDQRAAQLVEMPVWRAQGRIAFKSGKEGGQGNMTWVQEDTGTHISLRGPFGAGAYEIAWDAERVVVNSKKGEQVASYTGRDAADRFLERQLGWSFPARSIRYWLLGVADPEYDSRRRLDEAGWLSHIDQNGWAVEYSRFDEVGDQYMPGKIVMENDRARVKLVVDKWSF